MGVAARRATPPSAMALVASTVSVRSQGKSHMHDDDRPNRNEFGSRAVSHSLRLGRINVKHSKKARATKNSLKKSKGSQRAAISSSSPLGMIALHLLAQWKQSGRSGIVFLAE